MMRSMLTVGRLATQFGLSRSTLLYYDSIGLLVPSHRSESGYRLYSTRDEERLREIMLLRDLGVPLNRMRAYLEKPKDGLIPILLQRVFAINSQIRKLKLQQQSLLALIEADGSLSGAKSRLLSLDHVAKDAGISERNYREVHRIFEQATPRAHRRFLRFLGFSEEEICTFLETLKP